MPYTEAQRNWLTKLVGIDPTSWATDESQRQALLDPVLVRRRRRAARPVHGEQRAGLCGNQNFGAPPHRRDPVPLNASA